MNSPLTVKIDLGRRSYAATVGAGLLTELGSLINVPSGSRRTIVITDSNVAGLYGQAAMDSLRAAGIKADIIDFPAGEQNKNLRTVEKLFDRLFKLSPPVGRDSLIIALGGGVAGDVAGFVAATALRGLDFIQCPTTLLAAVDSSVGGKTGVDHSAGKNLIGAFHQPVGVLVDVETFRTLPEGHLQSGLAECVKHAMIRDESLLEMIEANVDVILECRSDMMIDLVARNIAIKAAVVSADEREGSVRAHLNFGHTVGHAVETLAGYGNMTHGQVVAFGMIVASGIAVRRGLLGEPVLHRLVNLLGRLGLATAMPHLDTGEIWTIMQHDKKARGGKVRMVLPTAIGEVGIFDDVTNQEVASAMKGMQ